jgi:hypothetical protein
VEVSVVNLENMRHAPNAREENRRPSHSKFAGCKGDQAVDDVRAIQNQTCASMATQLRIGCIHSKHTIHCTRDLNTLLVDVFCLGGLNMLSYPTIRTYAVFNELEAIGRTQQSWRAHNGGAGRDSGGGV